MMSNRGLTLLFSLLYTLASGESPHLKYTREVNEAAQKGVDLDDFSHGHSHGAGGCSHGHAHHDHGHSHDEHAHDHGHGHGYSHDDEKANGAASHSHGHSHERLSATVGKAAQPNRKAKKEYIFDSNGMLYFLNDARTRLWFYSIGSTLLISAFPCLILAFIPIQSDTDENSTLLKVLLAFGAGGLLGDAFLHLIPHATPAPKEGHTHSHSHAQDGHAHEPHDMSVGQYVVAGFMVFFIVEKFVRIMRGDDEPHGHSHAPPTAAKKAKYSDASDDSEASQSSFAAAVAKRRGSKSTAAAIVEEEKKPRIRVAAYLNLVADFMHNFTDGLAIGASFIAGSTVGVVTMITVLVHEVPHEIGDFAILIRSGYSKGKAMLIQLCTAGGALAGCVISLLSVDAYALAEAAEQSWVLPFTAGGFIYIATVSVIPELLERSTFWQSVIETLAIVLGVFLMYLIAFYE